MTEEKLDELEAAVQESMPATATRGEQLERDLEYQREKSRRERDEEVKVQAIMNDLARVVNVMSSRTGQLIANAFTLEHPTLSGQIARAIALGVMRHATREPEWMPGMGWEVSCMKDYWSPTGSGGAVQHPSHDGRWVCSTVHGAMLMCQQPVI